MARAGSPLLVTFVAVFFAVSSFLSANLDAALIKPAAESDADAAAVGELLANQNSKAVANYKDGEEAEEPIFIPAADGCGGSYTGGFSGTFGSPNYPSNYDNDLNCVYDIEVSPNYWIRLNFISFTTEAVVDVVTVYGAYNAQSNFTSRYSGSSLPAPQVSKSNWMRITFVTNPVNTFKGFQASYERIDGSECGGDLGGLSGSFASPNYPKAYFTDADCLYSIDVSLGHTVYLNFTAFSLASGDYVYIHDGPTLQDPARSYTGVSRPPPFTSTSHQVLLRFTSSRTGNSAGSYTGFLASYTRM